MASTSSPHLFGPANQPFVLGLSICVAVLLNLCALGAFGGIVEQWHDLKGPTQRTLWITSVNVRPAAVDIATPPSSTPATVQAVAKRASRPSRQQPAVLPAVVASIDDAPAMRFYRSGEVDLPAAPESDWNLDAALFDAGKLDRMVFDVFVDSSGEVVGCAVLEPQDIDESLRQSLEGRLRSTVMLPALRDGVTVASVRRIEISVQ
jgi:hypothetical protein